MLAYAIIGLVVPQAQASGLSRDISPHPIGAAATTVGPFQLTQRATPGSFRAGWSIDLTHRPMDQTQCADANGTDCSLVIGHVIGQRAIAVGSVAVALSQRTWVELDVPVAGQWGGTVDAVSPSGVVLGDPRLGIRSRWLDKTLSLDVHASLTAPLGAPEQWFAEPLPTGLIGGTWTLTSGSVTALLDTSLWLRADAPKNTWDFTLGTALLTRAGMAVAVGQRLDLYTAATARISSDRPAVIGWVGTAVDVSPVLRMDVGVGRAITRAPGAGPLHARVTFTATRVRPERPAPPPEVVVNEAPSPDAWPPDVFFRVRDGELQMREVISFAPGDAAPSPRAYPAIAALADWLLANPDAGHVLLAAYAHTESSSATNYTLSLSRAQAMADALVLCGVPRSRLSYKGMGMLSPNADTGAHQVVVDGQPLDHITLPLPDAVDTRIRPAPESFEAWLDRRDEVAP